MVKNETAANQQLFRWYYMVIQNVTVLFCVHDFISFEMLPNTTGWNTAPNQDPPPYFAVDTYPCASLLITSVHTDNDVNQNCSISIHCSIRSVATDFWFSSYVTWHTSVFFLFPFLKNIFWIAIFPLRPFLEASVNSGWIRLISQVLF